VTLDTRSLHTVPAWLWLLLALVVAAQIAWQTAFRAAPAVGAADLPPPPRPQTLRLASFGEPELVARLAMLYLQTFDYHAGNLTPYRELDYRRLIAWLDAILALDPRSEYPLFTAARVYAEIPDPERSRLALEFIYRQFFTDPERRWPWLAHAALVAKHRLGDLGLARRYASAVQRHATSGDVPYWAKQMEIFILEDMGELDAARIMLGGLLDSGVVRDPAELRFLQHRLGEMERRAQP
jgi:hypothetical protein